MFYSPLSFCLCLSVSPQHLKEKFWNFIFYKFIFIFGVLNVHTLEEVLMWSLWFAVLIFLHLVVQLCKDRFEYVRSNTGSPEVQTHTERRSNTGSPEVQTHTERRSNTGSPEVQTHTERNISTNSKHSGLQSG